MTTIANLANMRTAREMGSGVQAVSETTDEVYSANPDDYFWMGPDDTLTDDIGENMILVRPSALNRDWYVDALTGKEIS